MMKTWDTMKKKIKSLFVLMEGLLDGEYYKQEDS